MKPPFFLSWIILLIFIQCDDKTLDKPVSGMLTGSWVNVNGPNSIVMDTENNFIVKFGMSTNDTLKYELSGPDKLIIYDSKVRHECAFKLLEENRLELEILRQGGSDHYDKVSVYKRVE
jgi:hypothetical protein